MVTYHRHPCMFASGVCILQSVFREKTILIFSRIKMKLNVFVLHAGNAIVFINSHLMCSARCPSQHIFMFTIENYRQTSKNVANVFWFFPLFLCLHKIVLFWLGNNGFQSSFYFHNYAKTATATAARNYDVRKG